MLNVHNPSKLHSFQNRDTTWYAACEKIYHTTKLHIICPQFQPSLYPDSMMFHVQGCQCIIDFIKTLALTSEPSKVFDPFKTSHPLLRTCSSASLGKSIAMESRKRLLPAPTTSPSMIPQTPWDSTLVKRSTLQGQAGNKFWKVFFCQRNCLFKYDVCSFGISCIICIHILYIQTIQTIHLLYMTGISLICVKKHTTTFWPWAKQEHLGQTQRHSPHSFALKSSPMDASPGGAKGCFSKVFFFIAKTGEYIWRSTTWPIFGKTFPKKGEVHFVQMIRHTWINESVLFFVLQLKPLKTRPHSGPKEWSPNVVWCYCGGVVVFLWCSCGGVFVVVFLWWCFCGVFVVVFLWWCSCGGVFVLVFLCWCFCGGVFVLVFLWWCFCGGVFVVVFLWWCFCGGVFVVVFLWWCFWGGVLWWCFCGGVLVVVFVWWCFCGGVFVVVFLWWCFCGGVCVVVFLWWCFCGGVFVVVFLSLCLCGGVLWWCFCGGVLVVVFVWWCFCGGVFVVVFLWWCSCGGVQSTTPVLRSTTPYYKVLLQYYSVLQSTTPVLLRTTKYYSVLQSTTPVLQSTTPYYKALLQYYSVLQSTTPVLLRTTKYYSSTTPLLQKFPKRAFRARLPQLFKEQASKTSISCEASSKFHRMSFQNERFARCLRQFSQKKLPKGSFRAMLPPNFTEEASKTSVSRDASSKIHRTSFQKERFARCFRQFSQKKLPKWSFRARLPPSFKEQCFQKERFARCFRQFSSKICVSLQFRAIDTPIPARGFIHQKQNVPRTTTPCILKFPNVRFATAGCAKMYESIDREPTRFAHTKMWGFTTVFGDRHHVFTERVDAEKMKFAFRYSFGRSTPRFYWEGCPTAIEICVSLQIWQSTPHFYWDGWPRANEICVSLQFWAIDTTFLARGLTARKWNLRFATVLGDRRRVFSERVAFRLTLPIPPGGIE